MNLMESIAKEHSKAQRDRIIKYVGSNQARFNRLISIFLAGPYRITQRAAWPLSYCVERHPELIRPHLRKILLNLGRPGITDAVKRNTVRLLQFIPIPKSLQGLAAQTCYRLFENQKEPIAVRVFAMTVLSNLASEQPELKRELRMMIEDQLPYASAGFRSRARKVLKQLS